MLLSFIKFISVVLLITIVLHYLLFISFTTFFSISSIKIKTILIVTLFILSISFILSSLLNHFVQNSLSHVYYYISSIWYGLLVYLIMGLAFLWCLKLILILIKVTPPENFWMGMGIFSVIVASLVTLKFCWNAYNLKITNVDVKIKNLPSSWENKKIVHLSDVHIGGTGREEFLQKVIALTNAQKPDLIVITGDLFDGSALDFDHYTTLFTKFSATYGTYFISGNHEMYANEKAILEAIKNSNITILNDKIVHLNGLQLIGIPFPNLRTNGYKPFDVKKSNEYLENEPTILLYHTPTDFDHSHEKNSQIQSRSYFSPRMEFKHAIDLKVDLQLSGHTHGGQFFPFTLIAQKIYGEFNYGLTRVGDFQIFVHGGTGTWGPPLRSGPGSEIVVLTLKKS